MEAELKSLKQQAGHRKSDKAKYKTSVRTGNELKKFAIKDGAGLVLAHAAGIEVMILTGRECEAVRRRAADLHVEHLYQNVSDKAAFLRAFLAQHSLRREETAYCGDDLNDLAAMALCGFVACPADATPAVAARADYRCPRRGGEGAVRDAVEMVGLNYEEVKGKSPFDLSGGQKRRAAIAGVIVTRPHILILDEPAAGLDPLGKKEIMELLHKLHREWCSTVIIVSHDMDEIADNCTMAAVISEGRVADCAAPRELFAKAEELDALGLDVPLTAKACAELGKAGIKVDTDFTCEDFAAKAISLFEGGEESAQ